MKNDTMEDKKDSREIKKQKQEQKRSNEEMATWGIGKGLKKKGRDRSDLRS